MPYLRRVYTAPAELEDLVLSDLWEAGTLGVQTLLSGDDVRFDAWFPVGSPPALPQRPGVRLEIEETLPDMDWLADYREKAQPFPVAAAFFVDPREPEREPEEAAFDLPAGRRLLRLPARTAFGTGSHESTSLTLELLETMDVAGARVLDVGTGTGILSFAALQLGAREAVAYDVDPASPVHARDNSVLNGLRPLLFAGTSAALSDDARFDLLLINVVPEQILPEMPGLVRRLEPGGEALLSGILADRGAEVLEHLRPLGLVERGRREAAEWVAFRVALENPAWR